MIVVSKAVDNIISHAKGFFGEDKVRITEYLLLNTKLTFIEAAKIANNENYTVMYDFKRGDIVTYLGKVQVVSNVNPIKVCSYIDNYKKHGGIDVKNLEDLKLLFRTENVEKGVFIEY